MWMQKFIGLYKSLAITEAKWKPKDNMYAISYAFGVRKRVPY